MAVIIGNKTQVNQTPAASFYRIYSQPKFRLEWIINI